jgi:hypothetical protein
MGLTEHSLKILSAPPLFSWLAGVRLIPGWTLYQSLCTFASSTHGVLGENGRPRLFLTTYRRYG